MKFRRGDTHRAAIQPYVGIVLVSFALLCASLSVSGCSGKKDEPKSAAVERAAPEAAREAPLPPLAYESALPEACAPSSTSPSRATSTRWSSAGSCASASRTTVRFYFVDQGVQRGIAYEYGKLMEDELNKRRKTGNLKVVFWFVPLPRDQLLPALVDGKVDMVMAQLTGDSRAPEAGGLHEPHPQECKRNRGDRPRRASDCLGRRPRRAGGIRPQEQQLLPEPARAQRAAEGGRQGTSVDSRGARRISRTTTCSRWSTPA